MAQEKEHLNSVSIGFAQINEELEQRQKVIVLIRILEFI